MSLSGKTAIVTGSNSGIGLGLARELAKAGAPCGCGHLHYRACATSTLSVRLCRTAFPEPGQARHSLEFPPAFWVSSPPGYED